MQFFSVEKKDYSLTYIMENKYNNEIKFKADDKINFTFTISFLRLLHTMSSSDIADSPQKYI